MAFQEPQISVTFRGVEHKPEAREYALHRLEKTIRSIPSMRGAGIEIGFEHTRPKEQHYRAQVTVWLEKHLLRVEDHGPDTNTAIDKVHDLLERRLREWKSKVVFGRRRETAALKEALWTEATRLRQEDQAGRIVRMKSHEIKPTGPEDAIDQMEMLGHDFFFFLNADTGQYTVVYRRKAGGYGLIEPAAAGRAATARAG